MKIIILYTILGTLLYSQGEVHAKEKVMSQQPKLYSFVMKTIDDEEKSLSDYKGKVLLIVNVASKCGNTPQYEGLEKLYQKYKDRGFMILGFPANNFLHQEPGTDAEIKKFCTLNYNVTFDLFSKISVKGNDQHPLYRFLTEESSVSGDVKWNFQKYLIDRHGNVVEKFSPKTDPLDQNVVNSIERLLDESVQ